MGKLLRRARSLVTALVAATCLLPTTAGAADKEPTKARQATLTADDRELLDSLFKQGLFDPTGAQRIRVETTMRTLARVSANVVREAWLQKGTAGQPGKIVFIEGEAQAVRKGPAPKTVDFIEVCRSRFPQVVPLPPAFQRVRRIRHRRVEKSVEEIDKSPLAAAAWLHRLGHDDLAVRALSDARAVAASNGERIDKDWLLTQFRTDLASIAFQGMIHAFLVAADDEALAAGERFVRLYPDQAKHFRQTADILGDLRRRKLEGKFGKTRLPQWPAGFASWDTNKQVAYLIGTLDQVDGQPFSQPLYVMLVDDPSVKALIRIGDPAIPALIATIENDSRLTRCLGYQQPLLARVVLGVREAALDALMSITGTVFFDANLTGENFTQRGAGEVRQVTQRFRTYWDRYGRLPFDERMMKILTDPVSDFESKRQAAGNLAHLDDLRQARFSQICYESNDTRRARIAAIQKFKNPTIAGAMLTALDEDIKHHDAQPRNEEFASTRCGLQDLYMRAVVTLGDRAIASELTRRSAAAWQVRERQLFAKAANELGAPGAMRMFAKQVERGGFTLPANDQPNLSPEEQPGSVVLCGMIQDLERAGMPETERALFALSDPQHPYYEQIRERLAEGDPHSYESTALFLHPYCLKILRRELDDHEATGGHFSRDDATLTYTSKDGSTTSNDVPGDLGDAKLLKVSANERRCDRAASQLAKLVFGLPPYHPLQRDVERRFAELKKVFDSFSGGLRRCTPLEAEFLQISSDEPLFLPQMPPLNRPARPEDVKAGRALFELNGKGKLAELRLPAVASPKKPPPTERRTNMLLIVQAEIDAQGKTHYGVIGEGGPRVCREEELTGIKPIRKSFFDFFR